MILGVNLRSIMAKMNADKIVSDLVDIKSTPVIEKVDKKDIGIPGVQNTLGIDFSFETKYGEAAEIRMEGELIYQSSADDVKKILDGWKKDRALDERMGIEVKILDCLIHGWDKEEEVNQNIIRVGLSNAEIEDQIISGNGKKMKN